MSARHRHAGAAAQDRRRQGCRTGRVAEYQTGGEPDLGGKTSQLPMAIESGRKHGMVALNDALVAFVEGGIVESREAYRFTADQPAFLAMLERHGVDTSFVERLA